MISSFARRLWNLPERLKTRVRIWRDYRNALQQSVPVVQDSYGVRFILYPWNRPNFSEMLRREHDVGEMTAIPLLVRDGDTVFDIGANIGAYAVTLSRLCGSGGRVFAFEPVPDTYWTLCETLALNRCENVIPSRMAVSSRSGRKTMNLFEPRFAAWNTFGTPRMLTPEGNLVEPSKSIEVPTISLDEFCARRRIEKVNFLKVDVEGFETSVFEGAERLLCQHLIDTVCFEISQAPLRGANAKSADTFFALERHGYSAYLFNARTRRFEGPIHDTTEEFGNFYSSYMDLTRVVNNDAPAKKSNLVVS